MTNDNFISVIQQRRQKFLDEGSVSTILHRDRQKRLIALVNKYGYDYVVAASGLSHKTIEHYCRVTRPPTIGETPVFIAELVFKGHLK